MNETITWQEGNPPPSDEMVAVMHGGGLTIGWYDFSAERWRDVKYQLLNRVTHWAEIKGPPCTKN